MAKATWLKTTPPAGETVSGNRDISNVVGLHTGRKPRNTTVTLTTKPSKDVVSQTTTYNVTQDAHPLFISLDNSTITVGKNGSPLGSTNITGHSNVEYIQVRADGSLPKGWELRQDIICGNQGVMPNFAVPDGMGVEEQYRIQIQIQIPENTSVSELQGKLIVEYKESKSDEWKQFPDNSGKILIIQDEGLATISVDPNNIEFPYTGDTISVSVTSNTSWTVS